MVKTAYKLIALLLFLVVVQVQSVALERGNAHSAVEKQAQNGKAAIGHTSDDLPQWEDFGMENVLVVGGQPTVTAPVSERPEHEYGSVFGRCAEAMHRFQHSASERSALPHRAQSGYIYHLVCLRL